ncbi:MAG TPA: SEC-C metal-binding domain-containing protein, partial [Microvirga sp.]|nr:SEC-C metal-binding domain-containing protein [Microvirga sp.]
DAEVAEGKRRAIEAGGLWVIATERHESRRIDNQLRGRSGRQGDPGASKFFLSLEDDLMRIFGSDRMDGILQRLGLKEGEAIVHAWINKALEKAQQKVEARNFEIRKNLLRYDDVMNDQRKVIYEQRKELMRVTDVSDTLAEMRQEVIEGVVRRCIPENAYAEQWDTKGLHEECLRLFGLDLPVADWAKEEGIADKEIEDRIRQAVDRKMAEKAANYGPQVMRVAERSILLQLLDQAWKDHLLQLDHLRHGIGLRAYAQRDPLNEYKREAFDLFEQMLTHLREQVTAMMAHLEIRLAEAPPAMPQRAPQRMMESREDPALVPAGGDSLPERPSGAAAQRAARAAAPAGAAAGDVGQSGKVQRNAPCPCGSGKKYKHCHGKI